MKAIDLKKMWGEDYRVSKDHDCEPHDEWSYQIKGTHGVVYPYSSTLLAVQCDGKRKRQKELKALGLRVVQEGDRDMTLVFTPTRMHEVAKIIKCYKRPKLSEDDRQRRRIRMQQVRAKSEKITPQHTISNYD